MSLITLGGNRRGDGEKLRKLPSPLLFLLATATACLSLQGSDVQRAWPRFQMPIKGHVLESSHHVNRGPGTELHVEALYALLRRPSLWPQPLFLTVNPKCGLRTETDLHANNQQGGDVASWAVDKRPNELNWQVFSSFKKRMFSIPSYHPSARLRGEKKTSAPCAEPRLISQCLNSFLTLTPRGSC